MKVRATLLVLSSLTTISGVALAQTSQPDSEPTATPRSDQTYTPPPQAAYPQQTYGQPAYDQPETPPPSAEHRGVPSGLQVGARAGFGAGSGSVYNGLSVSDGSNGFVPFTADIGARVIPELYVGAYGSYSYVIPRTNPISCPEGLDCSVKDWRVGLEADWHIFPAHVLDPYVGLFGGYELLQNHVTGAVTVPVPGVGPVPGTANANTNDKGWEAGVVFGSDIRLVRWLALGPYVSASLGRYVSRTGTTDISVGGNTVASTQAPDKDHAYHELYQLGIRGTMNSL
ncbi:MAG: hypothetical protein ACXVEE_04755 [Polyangiales bacterium]